MKNDEKMAQCKKLYSYIPLVYTSSVSSDILFLPFVFALLFFFCSLCCFLCSLSFSFLAILLSLLEFSLDSHSNLQPVNDGGKC